MIKITTLALALPLSFFSGLSSGHAAKYEFHNLDVNAVAQGGKVKGQGTTEQGGKLPNTATHYPAAILMGITTFLFGITLFVRRKK